MNAELGTLLAAAASIGFIHTVVGPDHYLPFVMIGKAKHWSSGRTLVLTFFCGIAHVLSSVVLGLVGIGLGVALRHVEKIESVRGDLASWALIAFGLAYFIWGMKPALQNRRHAHVHEHDGKMHTHTHQHVHGHIHVHEGNAKQVTPWVLFIIFILGPCEPLIPLLMVPAARASTSSLMLVTLLFSVTTVTTMLGMVLLARTGLNLLPLKTLEKYNHAIAGIVIFLTGLAIRFLGL
jgi:nickel/cobalt exporter